MRKVWILALSLATVCAAFGQQPTPMPEVFSARTIKELEQLQKASVESDYAYRRVDYLTNHIGPRLSGSAQAQTAVDYVASEMKKAGLDVRLERVMVPHWVRGQETGEVVEWDGMAPGTTQKIVLTALGGSIATSAQGITADVVVVNNFDELNALGAQRSRARSYFLTKSLTASWPRVVLGCKLMVTRLHTALVLPSQPQSLAPSPR